MKVYLASWFSSKEEIAAKAKELTAAGITVTSRWLKEKISSSTQMSEVTDDYLTHTAIIDVEDIERAPYTVLFTVDPENGPCHPRGGRHFESGYAYALVKFWPLLWNDIPGPRELIICGPKENIFHHLPKGVRQFDTWAEVKAYLMEKKRESSSRQETESSAPTTSAT